MLSFVVKKRLPSGAFFRLPRGAMVLRLFIRHVSASKAAIANGRRVMCVVKTNTPQRDFHDEIVSLRYCRFCLLAVCRVLQCEQPRSVGAGSIRSAGHASGYAFR